jgi:hypothetical protein
VFSTSSVANTVQWTVTHHAGTKCLVTGGERTGGWGGVKACFGLIDCSEVVEDAGPESVCISTCTTGWEE